MLERNTLIQVNAKGFLQHARFFAFEMLEFILQLYLNSSPNDPRPLC